MKEFAENFADNFYGVLFNPSETFDKLMENPKLIQSFVIVIFVSILSPILNIYADNSGKSAIAAFQMLNSAIWGGISWLFFVSFMEILAGIFKQNGKRKILLCLTGFALLPWIFLAPASLLKTGGILFKTIGILMGLGCWLWSTLLTAYAVVKAYNISPARAVTLILIPALGGVLAVYWIIGFFTTLLGLLI